MIISADIGKTTVTLSELRAEVGGLTASDILVVPKGVTLLIDEDVTLKGIVGQGTVAAHDSSDMAVRSDWIAIVDGGHFQVGSEANPFEHDFNLTLTGDNPNQTVDISSIMAQAGHPLSGAPILLTKQDSFLMVMGADSRLDLHGADAAKESWTQLKETAERGDTSITLSGSTSWEVGDVIVIAPTDFDQDEAEQRVVTAVSEDGRTISFERPLDFMHYGQIETYNDPDGDLHTLDMRAEVGLLSRNVRIVGDVNFDPNKLVTEQNDTFGGHTMVMNGAEMYISGTEFAFMGQQGILGKYPIHWHELGDASGQYVRDSSVHHAFNKGITIHDTNNTEITGNVVFETSGHGYFFEDGTETGNVLIDNLGLGTRRPDLADAVKGQEQEHFNPSTFWMKHPSNTLIGNHAAGSDSTGLMWATFLNDEDIIDFSGFVAIDNVAHTSERYGAYVGRGFFGRDENPRGSAEEPSKFVPWQIDGLTVYKTELAVNLHGTNGTVSGAALAENTFGTRLDSNNRLEDSLVVGQTDNIGTPLGGAERTFPKFGVYNGAKLHEGGSAYENVFYANLPEAAFIPSRVEFPYTTVKHSVQSTAEDITFQKIGKPVDFAIYPSPNFEPNQLSIGLRDLDGSITGIPGATITIKPAQEASQGFNASDVYTVNNSWNAIVSTGGNFATVRFDKAATPETNDGRVIDAAALRGLRVERDDGVFLAGLTTTVPVQVGRDYDVNYSGMDAQFRILAYDFGWGEAVTMNLGAAPLRARFVIDDPYSDSSVEAREVSSMAMLDASPDTAVYRAPNGEVSIKIVAQMAHGELWDQWGNDYSGELHSGVTVLVETSPFGAR
ncbi:MAG: G8 domain-containing protein [Pseudomonadota bacterium]